MKLIIPPPPPTYNYQTFIRVFEALRQAFVVVVNKDEAAPRVLLQSPDGSVYSVTVNNSGVLSTDKITIKDQA